MTKPGLTDRQREILGYIEGEIVDHPTIDEHIAIREDRRKDARDGQAGTDSPPQRSPLVYDLLAKAQVAGDASIG